jgi:tRNA nucleotidyltransferase (CCA-adding enzyme)
MNRAYPELGAVREAAVEPVFLVGGAVRDLLLGRGRSDIDLVVEGDPFSLAARLGADPVAHERFATARVVLEGHRVDIAAARTEAYARPGALPDVSPASGIEEDLARRDFTVNAMALPIAGPAGPIDPHGGLGDLDRRRLRVLHPGSFVDDPTRAIRAARYAARLGFSLEGETESLLRSADLGAVSAERRDAELLRLAAEASAPGGFALLGEWGLVELRKNGVELARRVCDLLEEPIWRLDEARRAEVVREAAIGRPGGEEALAEVSPASPSEAVALAEGHDDVEQALARAAGAAWLDEYRSDWSAVTLEIDGADLIAAGIPEGRAVGRGLAAARRRKLDGEIDGREAELSAALDAARES